MSQEAISPADVAPSGPVLVTPCEPELPADPVTPTRPEAAGDSGLEREDKPAAKPPVSLTPNKVAKPGIAAAIAAFEKNSSDKKPPPKVTVPPVRKPTAPPPQVTAKSPPAARTARSTVGPGSVPPKRTSITAGSKAPSAAPVAVLTPANVANPSLAKSQAPATRAPPANSTAAPLKPNPRISNVNKSANPDVANKPSGQDRTLSATSAHIKPTPAGTAAPGISRRTSAVPPTNKVIAKTGISNGTSAATRRPTTASTASGVPGKLVNASSTTAAKRLSHGPNSAGSKTAAVNGNQSAAVAELGAKLSQAESSLAEKTKLLSDVESQLENDAKAATATQEKLSAEVQSLEAKLAELNEQSRSFDDSTTELEASKAELETSKAELATAHARIDELTQAAETHQEEHSQLVRQHAETVAQITQLEESVQSLKQDLADAQTKHEAAITELSQQHAQDIEAKLSGTREELGSENHDLLARIEAAEARTKQVEEEAASKYANNLTEAISNNNNEAAANHTRLLEELESTHSARVESLTAEHESALQTLREKLEAELSSNQEKLQALEENAATSAKELQEKHAAAIEDAVERARASCEEDYQKKLEAIRAEHDEAILKVEADLTELRNIQSALLIERDEAQQALEKLKADSTEQAAGHQEQIESLQAEHSAQLKAEFTRARDELQGGHIEQLQTFRETSQESTNQLLTSHAAELEAMKGALASDFASERANIESELVQLKLDLNALHSDLASTRHTNTEQSASIAQLTEELEKAKASLKARESDAIAQTHDSGEIAGLKEALEIAREESQESRSLLRSTTEDLTLKFEHSRERHEDEVYKHVEEKTLLQKELAALKEASQNEAFRIEMQQTMINEITQDIQRETTKREAAESQVQKLKAMANSSGGGTDIKLAELHEAHNAKTAELEGQLAEFKRMAKMAEAEALEMKNKYELLEHLVEEGESHGREEEDEEYEGDTTVDRTAPLETGNLLKDKTVYQVQPILDEA